jgi:alkylation response protein AidB-like acyl-CoA dehydrogenase
VQGGKHICGHQAVRHVLRCADQDAGLPPHAATRRLAGRNAQQPCRHVCMAKLFITETAKEIVLNCQQYVMGAYGYAHGFNMERYVRDILAPIIYGGSSPSSATTSPT